MVPSPEQLDLLREAAFRLETKGGEFVHSFFGGGNDGRMKNQLEVHVVRSSQTFYIECKKCRRNLILKGVGTVTGSATTSSCNF